MNSLSIVRLQFFTIRTHDLPAARRFQVERLGFVIISEKAEYVQVAIAGRSRVCVDAEAPVNTRVSLDSLFSPCDYSISLRTLSTRMTSRL
jgi:hypothetical protein